MIEFEDYRLKLNDLKPKLEALAVSLNLERARNELERFHAMQEAPGFWDDPERSQKIVVQAKLLEAKLEKYHAMTAQLEDLLTICEMALEENDDSMLPELQEGFDQLAQRMEEARLETLLTGEYDGNNALMSFHAGAGGTEAQDWCQMLYRMYTRWAERHGYTYQLMDYEAGDEAGIKSATILIEGENAYGYLKSENGVHRLVRVSPFDANARRQTSFAALEVMPELDILYMTRVQKERFFNEEDYLRLKDSYILTPEKLENAKEDLRILHPLPRVNEISVAVDEDPRACYFKQAQNGRYIRMALIMKLLGIQLSLIHI